MVENILMTFSLYCATLYHIRIIYFYTFCNRSKLLISNLCKQGKDNDTFQPFNMIQIYFYNMTPTADVLISGFVHHCRNQNG